MIYFMACLCMPVAFTTEETEQQSELELQLRLEVARMFFKDVSTERDLIYTNITDLKRLISNDELRKNLLNAKLTEIEASLNQAIRFNKRLIKPTKKMKKTTLKEYNQCKNIIEENIKKLNASLDRVNKLELDVETAVDELMAIYLQIDQLKASIF